MLKGLKVLLWLLLLFALVWAVVVGIWAWSGANPSGTDLVLYLLALPVGILLLFLTTRAIARTIRKRRDSSEDDDDAEPAPVASEDTRHPRIFIADGVLRLPIGDDPAAILDLLSEGQTRPGLDETLVDEAGFPVFASRIAALEDDDLAQALHLPDTDADDMPLNWAPEHIRTLALAEQILADLTGNALPALITESASEQSGGPADETRPLRAIRLFLAIGADWPVSLRDVGTDWLREQFLSSAEDDWPALQIETIDASGHAPLLSRLRNWALHLDREEIEEVALVLAAESAIGENHIHDLDRQDGLFRQSNPNGAIPSEGGAGLLLTTTALGERLSRDDAAVAHGIVTGQRETPLSARGRVSGALLQRLAEQALLAGGHAADDIVCILNDAGVDSAHGAETGELTNGDFAHLDPIADCLSLGTACGTLHAVATVACLALARARIVNDPAPVLVITTRDAVDRAALAVGPMALDSPDDEQERADDTADAA